MKKIIAMLSTITLMASMSVFAYADDFLGDTNRDGAVNSIDALEILEYAVGLRTEIDELHADITKDGEINSSDALDVLNTSVGLLELQPVENEEEPSAEDPTEYSKEQAVDYYNNCLKNAYSQPEFTVTKTEKIDVHLDEMLLNGKPASILEGMANKVIASNAAKGGTKSKRFTNTSAVVDAQERFILPSNLTANGVKSYSVTKKGAGYMVQFTLFEEKCDFTAMPPFNSSCTFPLDANEVDLGGIGEITSAEFVYPGTVLTAIIDDQGRVAQTDVVMPLSVDHATGKGMGQDLTISISGKWLCTNVNTFKA